MIRDRMEKGGSACPAAVHGWMSAVDQGRSNNPVET